MKNILTLRLSAELARALVRLAGARRVPKSQLVREAVSRYLNPDADRPAAGLTARALAVQWSGIPRLTPDEASDLDSDIQNARAALPASRSPWE